MYRVGIYSADKTISNVLENWIKRNYQIKVYKYISERELHIEMSCGNFLSDILIMDIQYSKSGISLASSIQEKYPHVKIIFIAETTAEASNIFNAEPTYLLLKPLEFKKFYLAMNKAIHKLQESEEQMLKLYFKNKLIRIPYQEIFYIESNYRYLFIHQKDKTDRVLMKLSDLTEKLPEYFVRCHQSYAVNINKIIKFEKNKIVIDGGKCIAVSRNRFEQTKNAIETYFKITNNNIPKNKT